MVTTPSPLNIERLKAAVIDIDCSQKVRDMAIRKLEILESYDFKCQKCGTKNDLTIHHKIKGSVDRGTKKNHHRVGFYSINHCTVYCVPCHVEIHEELEKLGKTPSQLKRTLDRAKEREFKNYVFSFVPPDEI